MNDDRFYSFLGLIKKSGRLVSGYNNCENEIKKCKCKLVIIAQDASANTKDKFISLCRVKNIKYVVFGDKKRLGMHIGKGEASIIGIKDEGMSKVVLDMLQ